MPTRADVHRGLSSRKKRASDEGGGLSVLLLLADAGKIEADYAVPCQVLGNGADAVEISLAENSVREPMHPADGSEAFRTLERKPIVPVSVHDRRADARITPLFISLTPDIGPHRP